MNPILKFLSGGKGGGNDCINMILKVVKAAVSGQSPIAFVKELAKDRPELQGYNLDDLEEVASLLAKKKGKNLDDLKAQATDLIKKYT